MLLLLLLAGCTSLDPKLTPTPLPVPASWPAGDAYLRQNEVALPVFTYRDVFRDVRLQALIQQALANNRDIRIAVANIAAARERVTITRANQFPRVDSSADTSVSKGGSTAGAVGSSGGVRQSYALRVSPSFEIDLFGRLASLTRAEQQRFLATEAAARSVRLTLIGDLADAWLDYAADSSLLRIAEDTAAAAEQSLTLTRARLRGGVAPATDLLQAQQVLETARQDVAEQRTARAQDANLIQLLVGAPIAPGTLPESIERAGDTFAPLPAGLDSRVLLRRPDVVQAEFTLYAANAEIGAARAALFPTISLTGLLGLASSSLTSLFSSGAFTWSAGAGAGYTIFNAGAGRANVRLSQAERDAALASYERAIQTAFREVADALADRGTVEERLRATQANVAAASETLRLVNARYRGGIDSYFTTLDAQRTLYNAQQGRVAVQRQRAGNAVDLYRALGADAAIAEPTEPGEAGS
ncbi:efflux transporter outer membrane subunit [Sphingomonas piscis]|uniref:Efflux transporter outer membrane subunit n=2 Tax=Sphingomonas piscis TaxID=2714943 RepID=A0A6G7YT34_9SPHN|nr:efflux transporter outer membrane subunit [Sphingomonas piscis]QIK79900.1 efflux transporter outer membrane subunit [Sphingomonas piscis]